MLLRIITSQILKRMQRCDSHPSPSFDMPLDKVMEEKAGQRQPDLAGVIAWVSMNEACPPSWGSFPVLKFLGIVVSIISSIRFVVLILQQISAALCQTLADMQSSNFGLVGLFSSEDSHMSAGPSALQ